MIIIGGYVDGLISGAGIPDPWPNGIGIYDLSELKWQSLYDASAESYITPTAVKAYNVAHPSPKTWSNPIVEDWFAAKSKYSQSQHEISQC